MSDWLKKIDKRLERLQVEAKAIGRANLADIGRTARQIISVLDQENEALRQRVAELEDDTMQAVVGRVKDRGDEWEIALAPDCGTWLTVPVERFQQRPEIGDIVTIRKPRVLDIVKIGHGAGDSK